MATRRKMQDEQYDQWAKEDPEWYAGYAAAQQAARELADYEALYSRAVKRTRPAWHQSNGAAWLVGLSMLVAAVAFVGWLSLDFIPKSGAALVDPAPGGRQAPPAAVRRGSVTTSNAPAAAPADQVQADIDKYNAAQEAQADQQVAPAVQPLPLNSAGEPVISQEQADQQQLSLQLAEQEANAAADQALAAERNAAYAEQASRAPDVSYEDAKALLGRDPCHVPRADPHTCDKGLYKPTPVGR